MQKTQLAAALVAVLGIALPAYAADSVNSQVSVKEKVNLADEKGEKKEEKKTEKKAHHKKGGKGKEGSCKGKEGSCKGKEGSCKGKEEKKEGEAK